jgi:predicted house-cleaning noncanonical NTP pyrophosphatase (MazG superfamily)
MKEYDKLIRDNIPEIIRNTGSNCSVDIATPSEIRKYLAKKLVEESQEFEEEPSLEELADIYEVIMAILSEYSWDYGWTYGALVAKAASKRTIRGGFKKRYLLKKVTSGTK